MKNTERASALGLPTLLVAIIVLYWSASFSAGVGRSDFPGHVGLLSTLAAQLEEGALFPLWTSDWNGGASLIFWYLQPLFSSYLLLPFADVFGIESGIRIGGACFLALAGLSMYGLGLALTRSRAAGFIGALVYVLNPSVASFVGEVGHIHQPISMAILPLLVWAWLELARGANWRSGVCAAITSALLFYDMERFWLTSPHAFAIYLVVAARRQAGTSWSGKLRTIFAPAIAVGLGMTLLVAFPTLPALFERPMLQWHDLTTLDVFRKFYSFPHLLALVDRGGVLADAMQSRIPREFVSLPGQWYQGIVALLFVAIGSVLMRHREADSRREVGLGLVLGLWLFALLVAFGVHAVGPKHWALFASLFDRDSGSGIVALLIAAGVGVGAFLLAALRSFSLEAAGPGVARSRRALLVGAVALGVLLFAKPFVLLANQVFIYAHLRAPSHFAFPALPLLLGMAACLATPAWLRAAGPGRGQALIAIVVALHLFDVLPYRFQSSWEYETTRVRGWQTAFAELERRAPGRVLDTHHYNPVADMLVATASDRDMAWSWLSWTSTRELGDLIKTGFFDSMRIARLRPDVRAANTRTAATLAALANVRFVSRIEGISPSMPESPQFERVTTGEGIEIYENTLALPYVQFYGEAALHSGSLEETVPNVGELAQRGIASINKSDLPPLEVLRFDHWAGEAARTRAGASAREITLALAREPLPPSHMTAPCEFVTRRSDSIELDCDFARDGVLVIAEAWFPNWRVEVGEDADIRPALRINHAFQGTPVAAGRRRIEFAHRPSASTRFAKPVSLVAWLGALGLAGLALWARRSTA